MELATLAARIDVWRHARNKVAIEQASCPFPRHLTRGCRRETGRRRRRASPPQWQRSAQVRLRIRRSDTDTAARCCKAAARSRALAPRAGSYGPHARDAPGVHIDGGKQADDFHVGHSAQTLQRPGAVLAARPCEQHPLHKYGSSAASASSASMQSASRSRLASRIAARSTARGSRKPAHASNALQAAGASKMPCT